MNLKSLSQNDLIEHTKAAIREENLATAKVLRCFLELERRKAYLGYSSLYELAIKHFEMSEGAAQRRISSMRLIRELPQYEAKILSGELSITNAAFIQSYFRRAKPSRDEKIALLNTCLKKSSREVEKEIATREPEADKRQDVRYSTDKRIRLSLNISEELYQTLEKLKYEYRATNFEEVIERLTNSLSTNTRVKVVTTNDRKITSPPAPAAVPRQPSRHVPSVTKKILLKKVMPKCSYKHPETGKECDHTAPLEFDHIIPFSKGGPHLVENLRLLCSYHNKLLWQTEQRNL